MSKRPWLIAIGAPATLAVVALAISQLQPRVEAGGRATPAPAGACAGVPGEPASSTPAKAPGRTWWRIEDALDATGTLVGRRLFAGVDRTATVSLELGAESMASGPVNGAIVAASDDGRFSEVRLVLPAQACSMLVHRTEAVVRSAILDPFDGTVLAHEVARETRDDLGTWRISGRDPDDASARIVAPLGALAGLGEVWSTQLRLGAAADWLAVQSCAERRCVTRLVPLRQPGAVPQLLDGDGQGAIIGLTGRRLVTWAHCPGLPCGVQGWDVGTGKLSVLADHAVGASVTPEGRYLLAVLDASTGRAVRVDLASGASAGVLGVRGGELPLSAGGGAFAGFEVGPDEIALMMPGGDPRPFSPGSAPLAP